MQPDLPVRISERVAAASRGSCSPLACQSRMLPPIPPPPLPEPQPRRGSLSARSKLLIALGSVPACLVGALIVLRLCRLVLPCYVPTGAMTPAVAAGDHVVMEGITFLFRQPRRGEIIAFKTDGIVSLPPGQL